MPSILPIRFVLLGFLLTTMMLLASPEVAWGVWNSQGVDPANTDEQSGQETDRIGVAVRIPLPIDGKVSADVRRKLKLISEKAQLTVRPEDRTVVVLEFDTADGKTGRGSELEACMALALYLGDPDLNRLQTVAYIPANRGYVEPGETDSEGRALTGQLNGHAVLVAVAANQIAIDPGAAIGKAGIDDANVKSLFREVYRSVATERGTTFPVPVVLSMLDKQLQLFRVTLGDGSVQFVNDDQWQALESSGQAVKTKTIAKRDAFALLTGRQLSKYGLVDLTPTSRTELARMLDLAPYSLEGDPAESGDWRAVQFELPPTIDSRTVKWLINSLKQQVGRRNANLIILNIEDNTGDVEACLRLAQYLAEYNPDDIRTVAFVHDRAQGAVGLVALACDHLVMAPDARLGGQSELEEPLDDSQLESLRTLVKNVAEEKQSDWSMMMQMLDPTLTVTRYRHAVSRQLRLLCNEELEATNELDQWIPVGPIGGINGIPAASAADNQLVRTIAEDDGEVQTFYQLEEYPVTLRPSASDRWIERFAAFLTSPLVSPLLLFGAMFFFSTEMSAPGLGFPGFLAAVCFVLFFWSQSLDGNADWLEIIMFIVGVIFVGMEVLVLPGFGVFGIGGILLVATSLVLASQSFLIPRSSADVVQMSYSLLPLIGAGFGVITAAVVLRKIIPHSPLLSRMILQPRQYVDTGLQTQIDPEAVVDWSFLEEQAGETITRLNPSGKARIGGRVYDVISKGQMIAKGEPVIVIEAIGNRVVVKIDDQVG